jgi:hypothetical protein
MSSVVLLPGVLRGMDREEKCEVLARKTSSQAGAVYCEGFVLNAPAGLPDGEYIVTFDRHTLRATKQRGMWLASTDVTRSAA